MATAKGLYLFANRKSVNRRMINVHKRYETAPRKAKISHAFRFYDLSDTFGSRLAMAGVDLATLKELMGRSNISITLR